MPALAPSRQPEGPLAWFGSAAGQGLLAVEAAAMTRVLAATPALPWCWLGVPGAVPPEAPGGRGVLLRREGFHAEDMRFGGALRCGLPLPLANEIFGAVLLQHALDDGFDPDELLGECERILAPGGTLWLTALNAWSPYRARWARTGLRAHVTGAWQASLLRAGFALDSVNLQWLGPRWRMDQGDVGVGMNDWLRAGIALSVSKRVHALVPPMPLRSFRWQGAAHSRMTLQSESLRRSAVDSIRR
ncbi:MAG TPA: methyltransferase domain-containing protein [Lysobacter sp.]|jgi:SAM-dependent methyltransferase|nr:methyltransferase domain-containing protein [Lysobacter sp.]